MTYAIGIDVGTTFSAAATWRDGRAETVTLGDRAATVPSVLFLRDDGVMLVGEAAVRRAVASPERVAREFKRRVGDDVPVFMGDEQFGAAHLTAQMVRWIVDRVTEREGGPADYAVLTHPASWGPHRRAVLAEAAASAGLPRAGLVPEPVAAGLYHASQQRVPPGSLVGVYDLGGGTFDAALLRKSEASFEVVGTPRGDDRLGGVEIDQAVLEHVVRSLGPAWPEVAAGDPTAVAALARVRAAAVEAKEALSSDTQAVVPVVLPGTTTEVLITRDELEDLVTPLVGRTVDLVRATCTRAGVAPDDLDAVLLIGGASRMPLVARMVTSELGRPVAVDAHPKYAVCLGAAIAAAARLPGAGTATRPPGGGPAAESAPLRPGTRLVATIPGPPLSAAPDPGLPAAVPDLCARADPRAPEGAVIVADLEQAELTGPTDRRLPRAGRAPERPLRITDRDTSVAVHIGGEGGDPAAEAREWRALVILAAAAALTLALALTSLAVLDRGQEPRSVAARREADPSSSAGSGAGPAAAAEARRTATLSPASVEPTSPGSAMLAVAVLPDSTLIATGRTGETGPPAVWHSVDGSAWVPVPALDAGAYDTTVLTGVSAAGPGGGVVAVGRAGVGEDGHPVVWRAPGDGRSGWAPVATVGLDDAAELHHVLVDGADLVAVGRTRGDGPGPEVEGPDGDTGDGAAWRSPDGVTWQRVVTTGLDGPGLQELRRVARLADGRYLAVGRQRSGAQLGPALWTSTDLATWAATSDRPRADDGTPDVAGLVPLDGGATVAAGTRPGLPGSPGGADLALWWGQDGHGPWQVLDVPNSAQAPGDQELHGLATGPHGMVAVGSDGGAAAAWRVALAM